jgi:hypothetical protein
MRLAAGGWRLAQERRRLAAGGWRLAQERRRLAAGAESDQSRIAHTCAQWPAATVHIVHIDRVRRCSWVRFGFQGHRDCQDDRLGGRCGRCGRYCRAFLHPRRTRSRHCSCTFGRSRFFPAPAASLLLLLRRQPPAASRQPLGESTVDSRRSTVREAEPRAASRWESRQSTVDSQRSGAPSRQPLGESTVDSQRSGADSR